MQIVFMNQMSGADESGHIRSAQVWIGEEEGDGGLAGGTWNRTVMYPMMSGMREIHGMSYYACTDIN